MGTFWAQVGAFLHELWLDVKAAAAGAAPYMLGVRVAHDTTVAPLLGALGAPAAYWVPYASHVEIELWLHAANTSASEVHVFFNGASLRLPQCSGKIPLLTYTWFITVAAEKARPCNCRVCSWEARCWRQKRDTDRC